MCCDVVTGLIGPNKDKRHKTGSELGNIADAELAELPESKVDSQTLLPKRIGQKSGT